MTKWICDGVEFKVGDKVKVVRSSTTGAVNGMGEGILWENTWDSVMDDAFGMTGIISEITTLGIYFETIIEDSYLKGLGYPLTSLEKVNPVPLPEGDLDLLGKDGIKYQVQRSGGTHEPCSYEFSINGRRVETYVSDAEVISGIESGFWAIVRSEHITAKEKLLAAIDIQMQHLITEKNKIEKELAQ